MAHLPENHQQPHEPGDEAVSPPMARPMAVPPPTVQVWATPVGYAPTARPDFRFPNVRMDKAAARADLLLLFLVFAIYFGLEMAGLSFALQQLIPSLGIFAGSLVIGLMSLSAIAVILYVRRQSPASIGLGTNINGTVVSLGTLAAVPASYVAMMFVGLVYFGITTGFDLEAVAEEKSVLLDALPDVPLYVIWPFAMFVGIHEEIVFRGLVFTRLRVLLGSNVRAVIVSSLVFGMLHFYQGPGGVLQTAAIGCVMAVVAWKCRSIWPAILAHGLFDAIQLSMLPLIRQMLETQLGSTTTAPAM